MADASRTIPHFTINKAFGNNASPDSWSVDNLKWHHAFCARVECQRDREVLDIKWKIFQFHCAQAIKQDGGGIHGASE